jgi:hypothetical protein
LTGERASKLIRRRFQQKSPAPIDFAQQLSEWRRDLCGSSGAVVARGWCTLRQDGADTHACCADTSSGTSQYLAKSLFMNDIFSYH